MPAPAPWLTTWLLAAAMFAACKALVIAYEPRLRREQPGALTAWALLWPGMDARADLRRCPTPADLHVRAIAAGGLLLAGLALLRAASLLPHERVAGLAAAAGIVLALHFGVFRALEIAWRVAGRGVRPIMRAPAMATSVGDLWSRRWNTAFSALAARFVSRPLAPLLGRGPATMAAFLASGLVHELVLTVPAGGGHGGPTLYFLVQGAGVLVERSTWGACHRLGDAGPRSRAFAIAVALLPLPLLLPLPVLQRIAIPTALAVHPGARMPLDTLLGLALWMAVLAHACVLLAGVQVPRRLRWREELARLSRFNRRIVWVYHGFIGFMIVAFASLTAALHDEMLRGDRAAVGLALMIGLFWTLRLAIDVAVYSHDDWPPGRAVAVGHALLCVAFLGMAATYLGVVAHAL